MMRSSRSFRPSPPDILEPRVVPNGAASKISNIVVRESAHGLSLPSVTLAAARIEASNASAAEFALSTSATLRDGLPVAERLTTTYAVGTPQTEALLKVPNLAQNSVTSDETFHLHDDGGVEQVVDVETYSGGTTPLSGPDDTQVITTTLPDGATQTETETVTQATVGDKTTIHTTIDEANGQVETITSVDIKHGNTTTSARTIDEPDGVVEHQVNITRTYGLFDSTSRGTTTMPGEIELSASVTDVIRLQPPTT